MEQRSATYSRTTKETGINVSLVIEGEGATEISTGIPFFDHMLDQLGRHSGFDLSVEAVGDLDIDAHHTVEDVGIAIGECFKKAIGDKAGVQRFATASCPLDEALVDVALDLSGRPFLYYEINPPGQKILSDPPFDPQLIEEFWRAFVSSSNVTVHQVLIRGKNTHHIIESLFKSMARALRDSVQRRGGNQIPSTKGVL
jgi:imidazoleglycerol-phosphate dehydratase